MARGPARERLNMQCPMLGSLYMGWRRRWQLEDQSWIKDGNLKITASTVGVGTGGGGGGGARGGPAPPICKSGAPMLELSKVF